MMLVVVYVYYYSRRKTTTHIWTFDLNEILETKLYFFLGKPIEETYSKTHPWRLIESI